MICAFVLAMRVDSKRTMLIPEWNRSNLFVRVPCPDNFISCSRFGIRYLCRLKERRMALFLHDVSLFWNETLDRMHSKINLSWFPLDVISNLEISNANTCTCHTHLFSNFSNIKQFETKIFLMRLASCNDTFLEGLLFVIFTLKVTCFCGKM